MSLHDFFFSKHVKRPQAGIKQENVNDGRSADFSFPSLSTCLNSQFQPHLPLEMHMLVFSARFLERYVYGQFFPR